MSNHPPRHVAQRRGPVLTILALAALAAAAPSSAGAQEAAGAVYVLTNQAAGNQVRVYARAHDGTLSFRESVATGGTGTITPPPPDGAAGIDPLASQGSLVYRDGRVFAVNPGSNDVSLLADDGAGLRLLDRVPSGGQTPTSIAVRGDLVYVLNAAGTPSISAFRLDFAQRHLVPLPYSTVPLPGGTGAAPGEVAFDPQGDLLVVTEKGTNLIDTFRLGADGRATLAASSASVGNVPFGFQATWQGTLVVADAAAGAASSYQLQHDGSLRVLSGAVSLDGQTAPCWLVTTPGGHYAYTGNAGTQSISKLAVSAQGALTLVDSVAASTEGAALDMALTGDGRYLYVRNANGADAALPEAVTGFQVGADGSLTAVGRVSDLPAGAQGLAVR